MFAVVVAFILARCGLDAVIARSVCIPVIVFPDIERGGWKMLSHSSSQVTVPAQLPGGEIVALEKVMGVIYYHNTAVQHEGDVNEVVGQVRVAVSHGSTTTLSLNLIVNLMQLDSPYEADVQAVY